MKVSYNITQNKFNASLNQETTEIKVSFKTGYYPLPVSLENYYTKNETDLLLENYYLKTETYSQNEVDNLFLNETLDTITERGDTTNNEITVAGLVTDYVQLDTTSDNTYNIGKVYWNADKGTYNFGLKNNVELQLGQEQNVYGKAYSAITNGQLVMYRTSQGGHILFEPANFTQLSANPDLIIGVATQDIALNEFGYITTFGEVNTLNTSSFVDGNTLYFGSTNVLQNTIPSGSYFIVGRVNRAHATQGSIFVKPYFVDGNLESKSNKSDSYTASSSTTYASTKALVDGLAIKQNILNNPITGTGTTNRIAKFTASGTIGDSQIFDNGTNVGIGAESTSARFTIRAQGALATDIAFRVRNSTDTANLFNVNGDGTAIFNLNTSNYISSAFSFRKLGVEIASIDSNGNFGANNIGLTKTYSISTGSIQFQGITGSPTWATIRRNGKFISIANNSYISIGIHVDPEFGNLVVGDTADNASAILQANSTTRGFLPPRMTTAQRNAIISPAAGLVVYDTTDNKHYGYNGTTWNAFY